MRGGQELLLKTQARYFQQAATEEQDVGCVALIEAVAMGSWDKLVEHCVLESWREVLAALVTYTDSGTKEVGLTGGCVSVINCFLVDVGWSAG